MNCWALCFEELVLRTHKDFAEPHSISALDTRGRHLTVNAPTRKKSNVPVGGRSRKIWNVRAHARRK